MRPAHITALVILASLVASSAYAAPRAKTGSRLPVTSDRKMLDLAKVRLAQEGYADCVVKRHRKASVDFVMLDPRIKQSDRQFKLLVAKVADPDCLTSAINEAGGDIMMSFPGDTMRYSLADALLHAEDEKSALTDLKFVPPLVHRAFDASQYAPKAGHKLTPKQLAALNDTREKDIARIYMAEMGECVVRADPQKAQILLKTDVLTREESAAFGAITPIIGQCIDAGRKLDLGKSMVRGVIAYAYYRLKNAPRLAVVPEASK